MKYLPIGLAVAAAALGLAWWLYRQDQPIPTAPRSIAGLDAPGIDDGILRTPLNPDPGMVRTLPNPDPGMVINPSKRLEE